MEQYTNPAATTSEPVPLREAKDAARQWLAKFAPLLDDPASLSPPECQRRLQRLEALRSDGPGVLFGLKTRATTEEAELLTTLQDAVDELEGRESDLRRRIAALAPGDAEGEVDLSRIRERIAHAEARREVEAVAGTRLDHSARLEIVTSTGSIAGALFLGLFSLGWLSFTTFHAFLMIGGMMSQFGWGALFLLLFYSMFWAVGIGMGVAAVAAASKEIVELDDLDLTVTRKLGSWTWRKRHRLSSESRAYVTMSAVRQNNVPSWNMSLMDADGKEVKLGGGRSQGELEHNATRINEYLARQR